MTALMAVREADGTFSRQDPGIRPYYSLTKTFIAAAIVRLAIPLDQPVVHWFGRDWVPDGNRINVRQLLTHSAGLRDYGALAEYEQAVRSGRAPWSDEEFADRTLRKPLLFEPGSAFSYANPGYWLLQQLIVREADMPFAEAMDRLIFEQLALTDTTVAEGVFAEDLPGYPAG